MIKSYCDFCGKEVKDIHRVDLKVKFGEADTGEKKERDACNDCVGKLINKREELRKTLNKFANDCAKDYEQYGDAITKEK